MNPELQTFIESLGLEYTATFVPQSQSRNRDEKHKSINWRIMVAKGGTAILTDYMQGIGHIPKRKNPAPARSNDAHHEEYYAAEKGRYYPYGCNRFSEKPLPAPTVADVLYSLVLDGGAADYSFEEWCSNYGYDTDSRKAEDSYNACRDTGTKLRRMLGAPVLTNLRELFQDY